MLLKPGPALAALSSPAAFASVYSRGKWQPYSYLRVIGDAIAEAVYRGGGNLLVSIPVRHGKSELLDVWSPAWFLSCFPERQVILTTYAGELAEQFSRRCRNTLRDIGTVQISDDSHAANRWNTSQGGGMVAVGVGGTITGRGGHLILVDDPIRDSEEADSETIQRKQIDWFDSTLWTRREPGAVVVVLMARWHEADLYGYLKTDPKHQGQWTEIVFPALAEAHDELGRGPGEALCPERYDVAALENIRQTIQPRWWRALYQQSPTSAEGAEIKRQWWRWYEELPVKRELLDFVCASWDCAFRDSDGSDYVVGQVWGCYGPYRYLLDQGRDRMDFTATVHAIAASFEKWKPNATLVEAKANGDAVMNVLADAVSGIVPVEPKGGKEARVRACAPQIEAGNVYLPKGMPWAAELVEEAAAFPLGKHDDQVDACSQALNWLLHHRQEHLTHLGGGDDKWVSPDVRALRQRGVLQLGTAPHLRGRI